MFVALVFRLFLLLNYLGLCESSTYPLAKQKPKHWGGFFFVRKLCEVHCHPNLSGEQLAAALHFCAHVMHAY